MADYFFAASVGAGLASDVVRAASTESTTIELRVTYTSVPNKIDVLKAIEAIEYNIQQGIWPPTA